jgi:Protein of unknown function (DUF433)
MLSIRNSMQAIIGMKTALLQPAQSDYVQANVARLERAREPRVRDFFAGCGGPCIKESRIAVDPIFRHLDDGQPSEKIFEAFPGLTAAGRDGLGMQTDRGSGAPRQRRPGAAVLLPSMIGR